jgi:predicted RNase H-like nuclease (RuvC/YqgF family)
MGGYDLYGNYYQNSRDAMNAEMAQCASIDAGIAEREMKQQQTELNALQSDNYYLGQRVAELEETIKRLEEKLNALSV